MSLRYPLLIPVTLLVVLATALAAELVVVEDWSTHAVGVKGLPAQWQRQNWGSPAYDFTIAEDGGRKVVHLRSANDSSNISKEIKGEVNLKETPILEWSWRVVVLPKGADSRKKATDDQAAQLYVTWPRFPQAVRSQIIGYVWDTTAPATSFVKSQKTGMVTYVIVRSGTADLGKWITERRNVAEDYKKIFGEAPDSPGAISLAIDSDDTASSAESFFGPIRFRKP